MPLGHNVASSPPSPLPLSLPFLSSSLHQIATPPPFLVHNKKKQIIKKRKYTYLRHTPINDEIGTIDKRTLITRQKHHGVRDFNGFAEPTSGEMDFAPMTLGNVVAEPVLQEWCTRFFKYVV